MKRTLIPAILFFVGGCYTWDIDQGVLAGAIHDRQPGFLYSTRTTASQDYLRQPLISDASIQHRIERIEARVERLFQLVLSHDNSGPNRVGLRRSSRMVECSPLPVEISRDAPPPKISVVSRSPDVTLALENADIRVVVDTIARIAGENILIGPGVGETKRITLRITTLSWLYALETAAKSVGLVVLKDVDSKCYRVVDPSYLRKNPKIK